MFGFIVWHPSGTYLIARVFEVAKIQLLILLAVAGHVEKVLIYFSDLSLVEGTVAQAGFHPCCSDSEDA